MSILVNYTLKSADDHGALVAAMETMVATLKSDGTEGFDYGCFETDDPCAFVGVLEFGDDAGKAGFVGSPAFATYRESVTPLLVGPPETTDLVAIASTRA